MKKEISLSLIIVLSFFVTSCNDDDDAGVNPIVGTWNIFEIEIEFSDQDGTEGATIPTSLCSTDYIFTIAPNGVLTVTDISFDYDEYVEGNLDFVCEVNGGVLTGSWELTSGNSYNLTVDGETTLATVNFSNGNNTFEIVAVIDETDDPTDPFTQTTIFRGNRS
jgi:hypothetical protein